MSADTITAMGSAIDSADAPDDKKAEVAGEAEQVRKLMAEIQKARDFDEPARKQYARDRRYARGDSQNEISVNRTGSSIDTLKCFYYAKDPDIDVILADQVEAPKEDPPTPPPPPMNPQEPIQIEAYNQAVAQFNQSVRAFITVNSERRKQRDDNAAFTRTLEIVCSKLWKRANMKAGCRPQVGSALTVGAGWMKITWQQQTSDDPLMVQQVNDLQDRLTKLSQLSEDIAENEVDDQDEAKLELQQKLAAVKETPPITIKGLAIDYVSAEDIQCAIGSNLTRYLDLPWIAHRTFIDRDDAKAMFPDIEEDICKATGYEQSKPKDYSKYDVPGDASADEIEVFKKDRETDTNICVWEIWHKDDNLIYTMIEGVKKHAREPYAPTYATTRWYPFFMLYFIDVDGERHPQSLVYRSYKLADEFDRIRNAKRTHRRRSLPGFLVNGSAIDKDEAARITKSDVGEMTVLNPVDPNVPLSQMFAAKPNVPIDEKLYETQNEEAEWERMWGLQDALQGSIQTAKTATEAQIQQTGTAARTGYRVDLVTDMLSEAAEYTAQIALAAMTPEDAQRLAGKSAFWPENLALDDIDSMVTVQIRAGSNGKPDTAADRNAWSALLPILQNAATTIAQLRKAEPTELADKLEALADESMQRSGDRFDIERFIPQGDDNPKPIQPIAAQPMAAPGMPGANVLPFPGGGPQPGGAGVPIAPDAPSGGPGLAPTNEASLIQALSSPKGPAI